MYTLMTKVSHVLQPETAHTAVVKGLKAGIYPRGYASDDDVLSTNVAGLHLPNCVGLAAGFDKNAEVFNPMLGFGFGFVECGTVTPLAQAGNPKPRLFRLKDDMAVINRMGFNNNGLDEFQNNLMNEFRGVVGANIGANKDSPDRIADYITGLTTLWGQCYYFTVNISSPNTPGLRKLQNQSELNDLLGLISDQKKKLIAQTGKSYPVFLKVAPDLEETDIKNIIAAVKKNAIDAVIVSNTTIDRPASLKDTQKEEAGGLSGRPVFQKSTDTLHAFYAMDPTIPYIGVGGVECAQTAFQKIAAGATAVQLYSALVYKGPGCVRDILSGLRNKLKAEGFATVKDATGCAHR